MAAIRGIVRWVLGWLQAPEVPVSLPGKVICGDLNTARLTLADFSTANLTIDDFAISILVSGDDP